MINIQKRFPFIEIIHHPITFDYKYELASSKKIKYRISRYRWYSFLKMQKKVAPNIKRIITPSKSSREGIVNDFKCNEENITVINNGLDTDEFSPEDNSKRREYRLITTASADVPLKGLDFSLKALKKLKKDFPKIHLVVIGTIKKGGHTEKLIKKLGIDNDVIFKSNLTKNEIKKCYSKSSIAIVSSLYEGFGYPVIEAMSCEVPLIATNVSSIPELTLKFAKLIEPKNEEMIYKSVKDILANYDKYKKIAFQGREHVINEFNWIKITQEYENIIFETIKDFKNANV
jgi:glycosyltransferase involved in cell wall biosynthesis